MFMTDYNKRKKGQGGSAFVREYYTKAFQEHPKHRYKFAGLNNDEKLAKMGELNQQYQVWKREEETVVTARNRLFEMYTLVRLFMSFISMVADGRHSLDLLFCLIDGGLLTTWPRQAKNSQVSSNSSLE